MASIMPVSCCGTCSTERIHPNNAATATMSRTHAEIQRLSDRIGTHVALATSGKGIQPDQVDDLLACLYGLYTLLHLHFLQEEENYFTLSDHEPKKAECAPSSRRRRATG